jgi:hypothetical protein
MNKFRNREGEKLKALILNSGAAAKAGPGHLFVY